MSADSGNRYYRPNASFAVAVAAFVAVMTYHALTLHSVPYWYVDEALTASRVQGVLETGRAAGPLDQFSVDQSGPVSSYVPNLPYWLFAVPTQILGWEFAIGSFRAVAWGAMGLVFIGVALLAWRYLGPWSAPLAILFAGSSDNMYFGHLARPDIIAAGFGYLALGVYSPRFRGLFAASFLTVLSCAAHARGLIFLVPLAALALVDVIGRRLTFQPILGGILGLVAGGLVFASINLLPYLHTDSFSRTHALIGTLSAPAAFQNWQSWVMSIHGLWRGLTEAYSEFSILILVGALAMTMVPRTQVEIRLWLVVWGCLGAGALLIFGMVPMKLVMVTPAFDLAATALFFRIFLHARFPGSLASIRRGILCVAVALYLTANIGYPWPAAACDDEYSGTRDWLQAHTRADATVMGQASYWMYLRAHRFISSNYLSQAALVANKSVEDAFRHYDPDYFIFDSGVLRYLKDESFNDPYYDSMRLSRSGLLNHLARYGNVVGRRVTACHGELILFELRKFETGD